ncbi:MAG: PIN domain-containing protein, partial [Blastocatellia bacterium]|nr:PIN domain-containing protein [Blastocatellia bacterium]
KMSVARTVLDSFALLAFLRGEPGEEKIAALLERAGLRDEPVHMTEVNYAEFKYITIRKDGKDRWEEIAAELPALPIQFHPATRALSDLAADFKARYKISLADAFAAALAKERKAQLVTGDPEFKALEREIKIGWLE